jgi:hypothetical protein
VVQVYPIGDNLIFSGKGVVYITEGGWRDRYTPIQPLVPPLDDWLGETVHMIMLVRGVECAYVDRVGKLQNTERQDWRHGFVEVDDVKGFALQERPYFGVQPPREGNPCSGSTAR